MRSKTRDQIKARGQPDAGCRLEPFVTKNRSLFSGVGDGSLVKSTTLHTKERETEKTTGVGSGTGAGPLHLARVKQANRMLTLRHRLPAGQPRDCRLPEVEKGAGTDEVEIYWAPRDGAVAKKLTPLD